jgi:hypothetical protein
MTQNNKRKNRNREFASTKIVIRTRVISNIDASEKKNKGSIIPFPRKDKGKVKSKPSLKLWLTNKKKKKNSLPPMK